MNIAILFLALQLRAPLAASAQRPDTHAADSARDLSRAKYAQAAFERSRRALLPRGESGGGRCDVRLGRFCWWYDGGIPHFPPENSTIGVRRADLLSQLDSASTRQPGDDWLVGMRVHYRIDAKDFARADSAAQSCRASAWWCAALSGYAAHAEGDAGAADSAFAVAIATMPADAACQWKSIAPLLGDDRDAYEKLACDARAGVEQRYWMLSRPRLNGTPNEWRNEFNARRVITWLGERSTTPHLLSWGDDAAELVLRYGWPVAWSKIESFNSMSGSEPSVIGHDPSPSFPFAARVAFKDSLGAVSAGAWDFEEIRAESRFAPRAVRRVANMTAQFARFRRGDSSLVVAAFAARHDSLLSPTVSVGAVTLSDSVAVNASDTNRVGTGRVMIAGVAALVGVDVADTSTGTLLRARFAFAPQQDTATVGVSDLLVFRPTDEPASTVDSALAHAIPGDTATRNHPIGLFWETYGVAAEGTALELAVSVERVDHSWIRSTKQKLGLTPIDTPIRMKWSDARPSAGRSVSLDLTNLDTGRYRVTLTLSRESGSSASTAREIELIDP